jgi:ubiquinone biosynthesis protein
VLSGLSAAARLTAAGWRLLRHDALLPREMRSLYPAPLVRLSRLAGLLAGPEARRGRPGERLARSLEGLGPVAIKFGQLLSTRADIFGAEFAGDLARLKDRLAPFPTEVALREVAEALGRPADSLFARFGAPVAAASLAQAHEAWLPDGRRVAVKVLRPGVERRVEADARVMLLAAALAEALAPDARRLEPRSLAASVIESVRRELDLRLEAAGADELREIMARDGYMSAPAVVWDGVGRRVLTLEWAQGAPLSDPASLEAPGLDRAALATGLIRAFLAQALDHGVFHADLHEGNLFVSAPDRIVAVDFGIVGRLDHDQRRYLAEILWGFLQRDYERVARIHFEAGYVPGHHAVGDFAQALRAVGEPIFGRSARDVSMSRVLIQLFEITGQFDMHLRPELVLLQKTMMTVEGVGRSIWPDLDIWAAADPVVRRWMTRELSPAARITRLGEQAGRLLSRLAALAEAPAPQPTPSGPWRQSLALILAGGALTAALAALALAASAL